jgi:hypothetical protein
VDFTDEVSVLIEAVGIEYRHQRSSAEGREQVRKSPLIVRQQDGNALLGVGRRGEVIDERAHARPIREPPSGLLHVAEREKGGYLWGRGSEADFQQIAPVQQSGEGQ